jgi:CRP-like cAMP-binding protein
MAKKSASTHPPTLFQSKTHRNGDGKIRNKILLGLPRKESEAVFAKLTLVDLELHHLMQEAGQEIEHCYFPNTMMASVLNVMADGKSVEVGLAGWEGFVGLPTTAGYRTSASRVVTQAQGNAFRISAADMKRAVRACPQLAIALTRYAQEATMEVTQIAACNRLHEVDQRLARWLLMSQDRIRLKVLPLTQEFLSQMLGTRRASVSVASASLRKQGLIEAGRGYVSILERKSLEEASCECYGTIRRQLESWRRESQ